MRGSWSRRLAVVAVACGLFALVPASAGAALSLKRCAPKSKSARSLCGQVDVPLDRSGVLPDTIHLRVRVLPAQAPQPSATVLALAGGPGQAATPALADFAQALDTALRSRNLVVFDQRGTGRSGRLTCSELAPLADDAAVDPDDLLQAAVAGCANQLGPARAHYATADSVEDIEAVRSALGVERLILYGTSYGTKVALDYAAAYPQHVERLVLDSVVPPAGGDPFERMTLGSIPRVLRALCAHHGCPFTSDPGADVAALARRLAGGPLHGWVFGRNGRRHAAQIVQSDLFSLLLAGDLDPFQRPLLPAAVRAALNGDAAPILRLAAAPGASLDEDAGDSDALFLATTCADGGVPWESGTPIAQREAATTAALAAVPPQQLAPFGADGVRDLGLADTCRMWPEAPVAQVHGPLPTVPTLILSGDEDLRTPRADALALARQIPGARVLTVPQTGHSVLGSDLLGCATKAVAAFLADRAVKDCVSTPRRLLRPAPVPPTSLSALAPAPAFPPRVGRTVSAIGETFRALGQQLGAEIFAQVMAGSDADSYRVGGLRGGSAELAEEGFVLRRYSYVPGVTLTGRMDEKARLVLHVSGAAAMHGRVRIGDKRVTGTIGGHRVSSPTAAFVGASERVAVAARAAARRLPGAREARLLP